MRTPDHVEIKAKCKAAIPALMRKHSLGVVKALTLDENGWVNPCFFVNGTHVMRFNARDPHLPKFQREKLAFDRLQAVGVPVPPSVILDDSKEHLPFDVLISGQLRGENLESKWKSLDKFLRENLAEQAGKVLGSVHKIEFPFFGELSERGPLPRKNTWWEYLKAKFELHLSEASDLNLFEEEAIVRFCEAFSNAKPALKEVNSATIVHGDAHLGNFLFADEKITGVLDFEWSCAGDPLYDMVHWPSAKEKWPDSRDAFLRGYGKSSFTESELKRVNLYQLIGHIEVSSVAAKYFPTDEIKEYVAATLTCLTRIESSERAKP